MRTLIAYSSGYGTTREVAEKIGDILKNDGCFQVTVKSIDDVHDLAPYQAVIVGSSVRADLPLANVRDFFAKHRAELVEKSVAVFAVCLAANNFAGREKVKKEYLGYFKEKYPEIVPISTEAFGGKIDFDRLNPVMQALMKRVLEKTGVPTTGSVDTRDWSFIEAWAINLKNLLKAN